MNVSLMAAVLRMLFLFFGLFFVVPAVAQSGLSQTNLSLRSITKVAGGWQILLPVPRAVDYSVFALANPNRIVIDVLDPNMTPRYCLVRARPIKRCRMGRLDGRRARFVFDLTAPMRVKSATLEIWKGKFRLKIILLENNYSDPEMQTLTKTIQPIKLARAKNKRERVVVIDPGHGGRSDIGSSFSGVDEKNLTLVYAKMLRAQLIAKGFRVYLTRTKDVHVPLHQRVWSARKIHADIIISLHADWNADPKVKGMAVYSLSNYSADKYARRFIESDAPKIIGGEEWQQGLLSAHDILFDLTQRKTLGHSIVLSRNILKEVRRFTSVLDQPHRFADFHLLSAPDLPAVLVELGFLSNQQDMQNLTSKTWQREFCRHLATGIRNYFNQLALAKVK